MLPTAALLPLACFSSAFIMWRDLRRLRSAEARYRHRASHEPARTQCIGSATDALDIPAAPLPGPSPAVV
jgi:hypothetical protein